MGLSNNSAYPKCASLPFEMGRWWATIGLWGVTRFQPNLHLTLKPQMLKEWEESESDTNVCGCSSRFWCSLGSAIVGVCQYLGFKIYLLHSDSWFQITQKKPFECLLFGVSFGASNGCIGTSEPNPISSAQLFTSLLTESDSNPRVDCYFL